MEPGIKYIQLNKDHEEWHVLTSVHAVATHLRSMTKVTLQFLSRKQSLFANCRSQF